MDLSPPRRDLALLSQFQVPDSIGVTDSLRVSFTASYGSCDTDVTPEVLSFSGLRSFAVWVARGQCASPVGASEQFYYAYPPSMRTDPFTIQFRNSGGNTSRVVVWR